MKNILKRWAAERATMKELTALSNRELSDIGINREDIRRIAKDNASLY